MLTLEMIRYANLSTIPLELDRSERLQKSLFFTNDMSVAEGQFGIDGRDKSPADLIGARMKPFLCVLLVAVATTDTSPTIHCT